MNEIFYDWLASSDEWVLGNKLQIIKKEILARKSKQVTLLWLKIYQLILSVLFLSKKIQDKKCKIDPHKSDYLQTLEV